MFTAIAFSVFCYSLAASGLGVALWLLGLRLAMLRGMGARITLTFAVFAIASAYVWLSLAPEIDLRATLRHQPLQLVPDTPIDV
jgi:hypothetical protein